MTTSNPPAPWTLVVTHGHGADKGRVVELPVGHCVMVGRSPDTRHTGMMATLSLLHLEAEDHALVVAHLRTRAGTSGDDARHLFSSFERDDDIGFGDDAVSGRHTMLFCDEAGVTLLDMGSTNGTWVNGDRVVSAELAPGDLVRIGETRLELHAP
ncbi:MAG TPA: FHA domain-containing protein [Myxococcota bacterium]